MKLPERIERKIVRIPFSGCWIWLGSAGRYGHLFMDGKVRRAHRVIYQLSGNAIPIGAELMHSCDIGLCVNPEHLTPGTHHENMSDMVRKGRSRAPKGAKHWAARNPEKARRIARQNIKKSHLHGELNSNAKVTSLMAEQIRSTYKKHPGMTMTKLGGEFGIGRETARKVVKGIAPWKL